jgi:hypothetical protein
VLALAPSRQALPSPDGTSLRSGDHKGPWTLLLVRS